MCPFSSFSQLVILLVTLILVLNAVVTRSLRVKFKPNVTTVTMYDSVEAEYEIIDPPDRAQYLMYTADQHVAFLEKDVVFSNIPPGNLTGSLNISGNFLGKTVVTCKNLVTNEKCDGHLDVIVVRKKRIIDTVFSVSVATLVSILYINFGCAIDWSELPNILKRPIGPSIGFVGQFVLMPLLSYGVGILLFPQNPEMQLGMFFTGVSPAGGASNVWSVLLEGNISLSIIMTTISTIAAFAMMPFWIFTLGRLIFNDAKLEVPYQHIMTYVIALVVPLAIGYLIQRYLKNMAKFMTRIIKGFSSVLIIFIIVFAIITNLYLFQLFSWQIIVAGMMLPWIGYLAGYFMATLLGQNAADAITIAIEIGIQNTGIAIFLLRFALPQPQADLTTVAPVSVAILTPFPLMIIFFYKKMKSRLYGSHSQLSCKEEVVKNEIRDPDSTPITEVRSYS